MKTIINREQWDFGYYYKFTMLNKKFEIIGLCELYVESDNVTIQSLYIYEKFRGLGYSTKLLNEVIKLNNKITKLNLTLYVNRDNFIYKKYKQLGFKKISESGVYDKLLKKYQNKVK